ncbi:hypothetical protein SpCBS45565_g06889 [Spizellomyces sp. 'palustris']|nr:hypothetical protein SpCBS45565_g06889 [Spizellomyces sp. 'palustris']
MAARDTNFRAVPLHQSQIEGKPLGGEFLQRFVDYDVMIAFKALITVHILMREGATDRVIGFVASNAGMLNMSNFRDRTNTPVGYQQSKNLRSYALYLEEKVVGYREIKVDFVRSKPEMIARLRSLPVEDGLLKEVELLQRQINALLSCTFYLEEIDNVVTLQAFRLLIGDMMALFHLLNEAVIRILSEYFEMSKTDATRALQIYKNFATQTTKTVEFFDIARRLRHALGLEVPDFKHAPISLAGALEEYLKAPDFEAQRLAYKEKKANKNSETTKPTGTREPQNSVPPKKQEEPGIDFFSSLDEELNALNSPSVQAQYDSSDAFGSYWVPNTANNPFGPGGHHDTNPFAVKQQELQKQTQDINNQLALLQAGLSTLTQPSPSNQLVLGNQSFPLLQSSASPFGASQSQQADDNAFTVENVFGNPNVFANTGMGQSSQGLGGAFGAAQTSQPNQSSSDPFASLTVIQQRSQNPTLDPFNLSRPVSIISQASPHNPFGPPSSTMSSLQQPTVRPAPLQPQLSNPVLGQSNYVATTNMPGSFSMFGNSGSNLLSISAATQKSSYPIGGSSTGAVGMGALGHVGVIGNPGFSTSTPAFNPFTQTGASPGPASAQPRPAFNPFAPTGSGGTDNSFGAYQPTPNQQQTVFNHNSSLI